MANHELWHDHSMFTTPQIKDLFLAQTVDKASMALLQDFGVGLSLQVTYFHSS
jgi:hypothetical protein